MGTSQSSKGPVGGVPMVPPWVDPAPPDAAAGDGMPESTGSEDVSQSVPSGPDSDEKAATPTPGPPPMAPAARFRGARLSLGSFARSGDSSEMRRGIGRYVRNGYGGGGTATRRFGSTTNTAGKLH